MQLKTARLTILIEPASKKAFEQACRADDLTPSQVVRRMIRDFVEEQRGQGRLPLLRKPAPLARRAR
jgi:hypothetical protein